MKRIFTVVAAVCLAACSKDMPWMPFHHEELQGVWEGTVCGGGQPVKLCFYHDWTVEAEGGVTCNRQEYSLQDSTVATPCGFAVKLRKVSYNKMEADAGYGSELLPVELGRTDGCPCEMCR